ncbi:uncharacterized protein LAESUDRAFT_755608 [Laetiporus sulphureus 93-53]|uniref:Uncharacterized protein n=1 Tax=Laetiporus sulphureus 93-53 TaxID=1314785 RepID=A0A165GXX9_9APHY|nr:uncharacterized protein LAESUDRAFT_755608 [Laetiporus sulphureus 93-53]KZT10979.1 hypothetical protein LAESUDRAFT_755608 [Laetiporus sulphureus 93-53]
MTNFPITEGQLLSLFLQSIGYGVHAVTYVICVWALVGSARGKGRGVNWLFLGIATALFVVGTLDVSFNFYHVLKAFIFYKQGATAEFERMSEWVNVLRSVFNFVQTLIADAAVIYRCWIVYYRHWGVIALPALIWLADAAVVIGEVYYTATDKASTSVANASQVAPFLYSYLALTLADCVLTTGLIVYRLWWFQRRSSQRLVNSKRASTGPTTLTKVNRIIIESALIYTILVALTMIVELVHSNAVYAVSSLLVEVAGIQFDVIIIRVIQGITGEQSQRAADFTHVELRTRTDVGGNCASGPKTVRSGEEVSLSDLESSISGVKPANASGIMLTQVVERHER